MCIRDRFEYSGEDFDTNIDDLDTGMALANAVGIDLTLGDTPTLRDFVVGETVSQLVSDTGIVVSGKVQAWNEGTNKLSIAYITSTDTSVPLVYDSFLATDTSSPYIKMESTNEGDRIIMSGTGQEGYNIAFEDGTASIILPSVITDGSTGKDNIIDSSGNGFLLESGTVTDSTAFDNLVVEDSLASRRSIAVVGSDQAISTDPGAFNFEIESDADGIIDFSEGNPFGEST